MNCVANSPVQPYLSIPLQTPEGCTPNDASVGDLDGDGEYEIVIKQEMRGIDNSRSGFSGQTKLEAYKLDGTLLWRIDLGRNIREGAHYTQFIVYDLDGDGRAEVACKTADGTVDGTGKTIGDANADYRDRRGYVLDGPEFLTIFDGPDRGRIGHHGLHPAARERPRLGRRLRQSRRSFPGLCCLPGRAATESGHVPRLLYASGAGGLELA